MGKKSITYKYKGVFIIIITNKIMEVIKKMEFNKRELEMFASNIVIRCTEADPSKYKQIRLKVKEIIDEFWDD